MTHWYDFKWVCSDCSAIHYYSPSSCRNCGGLVLDKIRNRGLEDVTTDNGELRLEIDRLKLDQEWTEQPSLFHTWAIKAADAQAEYDQEKSKLELTKSELYQQIREEPTAFGLSDKMTENLVGNTVITQPEHNAAVRRCNKARHGLEIAKAAVNALEHRKRALSLLVELWLRDYYSEATVNASTDEGDEYRKRATRSRGRRDRDQDE